MLNTLTNLEMRTMVNPKFDPYPIQGEESSQPPTSVALINARGGIPQTYAGYKSGFRVTRSQSFTIPASTTNYYIDTSAADANGAFGDINLGNVIGDNGPFIFIPRLYSISLNHAALASGHVAPLTIDSVTWYLQDISDNNVLYSSSPPMPSVAIAKLGIDIPLPVLRFDDFVAWNKNLNHLYNVDLAAAIVVSDSSAAVQTLNITQYLAYDIQAIS